MYLFRFNCSQVRGLNSSKPFLCCKSWSLHPLQVRRLGYNIHRFAVTFLSHWKRDKFTRWMEGIWEIQSLKRLFCGDGRAALVAIFLFREVFLVSGPLRAGSDYKTPQNMYPSSEFSFVATVFSTWYCVPLKAEEGWRHPLSWFEMRAGEKSRVPFGSHEEVKEVSLGINSPKEFFWFQNRCRETCPSVGSATVMRSLRKLWLWLQEHLVF